MLEAMSCWKVDWAAIGAVATVIGSLATAVAAGIAVWIGLWEPRRMQQERQRQRAVIAMQLLRLELKGLEAIAKRLLKDKGVLTTSLLKEGSYEYLVSQLACAGVKNCLSEPHEYPEMLGLELGLVYGRASDIKLFIDVAKVSPKTFNDPSTANEVQRKLELLLNEVGSLRRRLRSYLNV